MSVSTEPRSQASSGEDRRLRKLELRADSKPFAVLRAFRSLHQDPEDSLLQESFAEASRKLATVHHRSEGGETIGKELVDALRDYGSLRQLQRGFTVGKRERITPEMVDINRRANRRLDQLIDLFGIQRTGLDTDTIDLGLDFDALVEQFRPVLFPPESAPVAASPEPPAAEPAPILAFFPDEELPSAPSPVAFKPTPYTEASTPLARDPISTVRQPAQTLPASPHAARADEFTEGERLGRIADTPTDTELRAVTDWPEEDPWGETLDEPSSEQGPLTLAEVKDVWRIIYGDNPESDENRVENAAYLLNMIPDEYYYALLYPVELGGELMVPEGVRTQEQTINHMREELLPQDFQQLQIEALMQFAQRTTPEDFITMLRLTEGDLQDMAIDEIYRRVAQASRDIWTAQLNPMNFDETDTSENSLEIARLQYERWVPFANAIERWINPSGETPYAFSDVLSVVREGNIFVDLIDGLPQDNTSSGRLMADVIVEGVRRGMYKDVSVATQDVQSLIEGSPSEIPQEARPMVEAVLEGMRRGMYPNVSYAIGDVRKLLSENRLNRRKIYLFERYSPGLESLGINPTTLEKYYSISDTESPIRTVHDLSTIFTMNASQVVGEQAAQEISIALRNAMLNTPLPTEKIDQFIDYQLSQFPVTQQNHHVGGRPVLSVTQRLQLRGLMYSYIVNFDTHHFVGYDGAAESLARARVSTKQELRQMLHKIAEQNEDASLVRGLDNIMDAADVFLVNVSREARTNQGRVSVGPSETPLAGRFLRAVEVYLEKQSPLFSSDNLMRLRSRQGRARLFGRFSREDGLLLDSTGHANFSSEGLEAFARSYDYDYLVRIYLSELQRIRSSQARQKAMQSRPDQRGHAQRPVKPDRETPARSYPAPSSPGIRGQYSSLAPLDPRLHQHPERWTPPAKVPKSDFDGN